jgi:hypothetical protein
VGFNTEVRGSNTRNHKLAKSICFSYYLLCFLFNKIKQEGRTGSACKWSVGGVAQTMYTHVSKCKMVGLKEKENKERKSRNSKNTNLNN